MAFVDISINVSKCAQAYIWQITCLEAVQKHHNKRNSPLPTDTIQLGALCGFSAYLLYAVTGDSCTRACTHNCTHMQTPKVQTLLSKQKSLFTKVNNWKYTSAKAQMHITITLSDAIFMGENFQFLKILNIGWSINKYCHQDNQANNCTHCNSHPISPFLVQLLTNSSVPNGIKADRGLFLCPT